MTKEIHLSRGLVALVDDEDYEWLSQWKWSATHRRNRGTDYAFRSVQKDWKRWTVHMHKEIVRCPENLEVDHIDGDGLNNQKTNLRICTRNQNHRNMPLQKNNTSGYKGVYWHKGAKKWAACIRDDGKSIHIGLFDNPIDAAKARDGAAILFHKEFAFLNFPRGKHG